MGSRKKRVVILFVLFMFFGSYSISHAQQQKSLSPLLDIIHVMHKRNISVNHWGLYTKKIGGFVNGPKGYLRWIEGLKADLPAFRWTKITKDYEGNLKITGIHTDKKTKVRERFTVLAYQKGNKWGTYMIYEASGHDWNMKNWRKFAPTFYSRINRYFNETPTIFTCVSGHLNAKMNFVLLKRAQKLLQAFSAVPVEKLKEKTFVSLSAYTDQWKQSIQTKNHRMNLQVALRTEGGSAATVTIGTPIITTEY